MDNLKEENKKKPLKFALSSIFVIISILLLSVYWFIPSNTINFNVSKGNYNFSLIASDTDMQFYENMRFPEEMISYKINNCALQKKNDMERAFEILNNKTILKFYRVDLNPEIFVTCENKNKLKGGLFIAGEGGPTNITKINDFNVIFNGKILLIRNSNCATPQVALHELLHVLGFDHSANKNNIMYNISNCRQTISEDMIDLINKLYSIESLPDLTFESISATRNKIYLDVNISVKNNGLKDSENFKINIYADKKFIKEFQIDKLNIGHGTTITLSNLFIPKFKVNELQFEIEYLLKELNKNNNKIKLKQ
jgi:hypothetical protein